MLVRLVLIQASLAHSRQRRSLNVGARGKTMLRTLGNGRAPRQSNLRHPRPPGFPGGQSSTPAGGTRRWSACLPVQPRDTAGRSATPARPAPYPLGTALNGARPGEPLLIRLRLRRPPVGGGCEPGEGVGPGSRHYQQSVVDLDDTGQPPCRPLGFVSFPQAGNAPKQRDRPI